ncbi:MAG: site-specific DNA-methyltransferase [Spirochaetota bacterium]|nr:site-specific DNA-methyltransferase [Spirochaetota bacterium]
MTKEQKFYKALQDVFIGAKIEGTGGFVNLMKIKSNYYHKIEDILKKDIETALNHYPHFRDELFDKLYSFFSRYFTESGSIYFNATPFHNNIYEKVYTDEKDVILFWKTQMLYYVKTDRIFRSLEIESDGFKFYFDVSELEHKKANEKRSLIFELNKVREDNTIVFDVHYSEKGAKTKQDEIVKAIKRKGIAISEEQLERALRVFEKQSEVDFFINKNAKAFLQEQFKLWSYQYFWEGAKEWSADRVNQLQILKDIAFKIIDFISQFEDELVKIWNKPKFVKNSNYVITLDRITDKKLVEKIKKHKNYKEQVKEWEELGIDKDNPKAPIDTKYFKDLELEILSQFDDLDKSLDGWLIKSENYQALNTILPKFKEKVQTIYIDPPFNTGDDFDYIDKFQDSNWLSLIENRSSLGKYFINQKGSFFLHLDYRANFLGRQLLDEIFGEDNLINEIIYAYRIQGILQQGFPRKHDTIFFYAKNTDKLFFKPIKERVYYEKPFFNPAVDEQGRYYADVFIRDVWDHDETKPLISGSKEFQDFRTQKSEGLLKRIIETTTDKNDLILDFFLGSGTTTAVAHKLGRKWIGVEMGEHFYSVVLPRMKKVLAYDKSGISKEVKEYQGGGFFKYYELEQYEEALANCKYEESDLFNSPSKTPYQEYVFMKDEKMLKALEIDYENNKVKVDLTKLYQNIDIAETLSNLFGKWIKKIEADKVWLEGLDKPVDTKDLDYKLIKPLIWWE